MIRLAPGDRLVLASHNAGKLVELKELLAPYGLEVIGAPALGLAEPEETADSFAGNAALKAEAAAHAAPGLPALSDDSRPDASAALDGAPGIYSARWAGPKKDFRMAMTRIESEIRERESHDMRAHFVCALALAAPGQPTEIFEGRVYGALAFPPRGDKGFGYDPVFVPEGHRFTFGEMEPAAKHAMSHRARAFEKFIDERASFPNAGAMSEAGFGIYVHWPFCAAKCPYCDFNSHVRERFDERRWADAIASELRYAAALTGGRRKSAASFSAAARRR